MEKSQKLFWWLANSLPNILIYLASGWTVK